MYKRLAIILFFGATSSLADHGGGVMKKDAVRNGVMITAGNGVMIKLFK